MKKSISIFSQLLIDVRYLELGVELLELRGDKLIDGLGVVPKRLADLSAAGGGGGTLNSVFLGLLLGLLSGLLFGLGALAGLAVTVGTSSLGTLNK